MIRFNGCRSNDDSRGNMAGLNPTNNSTETQHERLLKIEINRCDGERERNGFGMGADDLARPKCRSQRSRR